MMHLPLNKEQTLLTMLDLVIQTASSAHTCILTSSELYIAVCCTYIVRHCDQCTACAPFLTAHTRQMKMLMNYNCSSQRNFP
uniref:Secreted protein n=1 Tax=Pyxicephalus adspersus TaxID=30357 RepID=A0AAV3ASN2_PYXAD|nr:TPA: hypothetical protein GDO54_006206 [Pyxicephalus adspersus]